MGIGFGGVGTGKVENRKLRDFVFCFEGRRRKMVEERKRVCILFVKGGDQGFGEPIWALA